MYVFFFKVWTRSDLYCMRFSGAIFFHYGILSVVWEIHPTPSYLYEDVEDVGGVRQFRSDDHVDAGVVVRDVDGVVLRGGAAVSLLQDQRIQFGRL